MFYVFLSYGIIQTSCQFEVLQICAWLHDHWLLSKVFGISCALKIGDPYFLVILKVYPQMYALILQIKKDEGKFVDLPGAEMGKVVVRFPPEASG